MDKNEFFLRIWGAETVFKAKIWLIKDVLKQNSGV